MMQIDHIKDIKIKGFAKLFHRVFLLVTYPLRHVYKFLIVLVVLFAIIIALPLMDGAAFKDVFRWYKPILVTFKTDVFHALGITKAQDHLPDLAQTKAKEKPLVKTKPSQASKKEAPKSRRRTFKNQTSAHIRTLKAEDNRHAQRRIRRSRKKASASFAGQDVLVPEEGLPMPDNRKTLVTPGAPNTYYRIDKSLPIIYLDKPQKLSGVAHVINANEIKVDQTKLFLYGIYTNPSKYDAAKATRYLKDLAEGKTLRCEIIAHTRQNIATAVCFLDDVSLNQKMVDSKLADNIAL